MITAIHEIDESKLKDIMADMETLGAPTIRAAETCHGVIALEGCHRLEAAHRLGLTPEIEIMDEDDQISDHGLQDFEGETLSVLEIIDYIGTPEGAFYDFE